MHTTLLQGTDTPRSEQLYVKNDDLYNLYASKPILKNKDTKRSITTSLKEKKCHYVLGTIGTL